MSGTTTTLQGTDATRYPYNSIVKITDTINGTTYQSTGILISPDEVLTADSAVYKQSPAGTDGVLATNVTATLGASDYSGTVTHYTPVADFPTINFADVQSDYAIIHLSKPVVGGATMTPTANTTGGQAHVTGFSASSAGALVDETVLIQPVKGYSILQAPSLGAGSGGSPIWNLGANNAAELYGLMTAAVSSAAGSPAYGPLLTAADVNQINAWVAADDGLPPPTPATLTPPDLTSGVTVSERQVPVPLTATVTPPAPQNVAVLHDSTTGTDLPDTSTAYTGPVQGLTSQFIDITPDNLFVATGSGNDAVALHGGTNVVDAGGGSNFLTGGSGFDTFFLDARNIPAAASAAGPVPGAIWDTIQDFGHGDAATFWGVGPGTALVWQKNEGAVGHTGLTLHANLANGSEASLTLAGIDNKAAVSLSYGSSSGSSYLYVKAA